MLKALYILNCNSADLIYGPEEREAISRLVEVIAPPLTADNIHQYSEALAQADVIFSGWGGPKMDETFLATAPPPESCFFTEPVRFVAS